MFVAALYSCLILGGRDSSVSIATRYEMDGLGIESRWGGGGGEVFCTLQTGPGTHPGSYNWSLEEVKRQRRVEFTTHPYLVPKLKKEKSIPLLPLWSFVASSRMNFLHYTLSHS